MRGRTITWSGALCAVAVAAVASVAQAAPGNGIRLGGSEARLHPFFDFETRYDSNVTYSGTDPVADAILHFRPGLELKAPGDAAAVEFSGALDWAQYLGLDGDTKGLSRMYAYAKLAAAFNRRGLVTPRIDNDFQRQVSTASLAAVAAPVVSNQNKLAVNMPWTPGGGALVLAATGEWIVESFEKYQVEPTVPLSDLAYNQYRAGGELQWRFLPRTTGVLQASYFQRVPKTPEQPQNANGVNALTGVTGLFTARVAATAKVGYGSASAVAFPTASGTVPAKSAGTFLADLAVEWLPMDTLSVRAGYNRSLGIDPIASIMVQDDVSALAQLKFAERYAFHVGAHWDKFNFQSIDGASTTFFSVDPTIEGQFGRWLTAGVGYVYSTRNATWPAGFGISQPTYSKNEAFLKVGVTY
jgi:hypothetical protein